MFWVIIDLIISHLGRKPTKGGNPPRDRNKIISDELSVGDILDIEEM